ncbi:Pre-rRNA-processing protein las1 [Chlorella vulgaris]
MSLGRAVPWASWDEWRKVGLWLLADEPQEVQRGLDRVAAWRTRGRVPLGVDSTACFVEAQQRDRAVAGANAAGMPLPPGVGASESLPRILVDLRHESTHNELPSLAALRLAARQGLGWLQANYWQGQSDQLHGSLGRIQGMTRQYLQLHQAAAAKVAASAVATADSEDESGEEEEAGRLAAASAAATLSSGRRAAKPQTPAVAPTSSGGGGGSAAAAGASYLAVEARKQRKLLLAELRSAVPRPAAHLLADALLAATAGLAPPAAETGGMAEQQDSHATPAEAASSGNGGGPGEPVVAERGLAAAMGHLCHHWPQLPPLLLQGAVRQLVQAAAAEEVAAKSPAAEGPVPTSSITCALAWIRRLLPPPAATAASQQPGTPAGGSLVAAACGGWHPSTPLLRQLLAMALPAQAVTAIAAACRALQQPAGSTAVKGYGTGGTSEALRQAVSLLSSAAKSSAGQGAADLAAACNLASLDLTPAGTSPPGQASSVAGSTALAQLAAAACSQQALLQRLQLQQQQAATGSAASGSKRPAPAAAAASSGARKRWRRSGGWRPCALGMLPCAADPNGRLPPLDAPAAPHLPVCFLQQQAAASDAADAAAARSADMRERGRACSQQRAGLLVEERDMLAAAATALDGSAPWPASDRFAAASASDGDDGGAVRSGGSVPVFALPAACSPLL